MTLVYSGVPVSPVFDSFWRTGLQVGVSKPTLSVSVRRGQFVRSYHPWTGPTIGEIAGEPVHHHPWYPEWTPLDEYTQIVGVKEVRLTQSNDQNGVASASIDCDNSQWAQQNGPGGIFHTLDKGYLSPLRGYQYPGRPSPGVFENPTWYKRLPNAQVLVLAGFGAQVYPIFTGLIDDLDISSKDVKLTITARDFGGVLVDEMFFGWVVDRDGDVSDPTIFMPRYQAYKTTRVGGGAAATGSKDGYPARSVTIPNGRRPWKSTGHHHQNDVVCIEVRIPEGRYNTFYLNPIFENLTVYMGVFVKPRGNPSDGYQKGSWFPQFGGSVRRDIDESLLDVQGYKTDHHGHSVPEGWLKTGDAVHVPADADGSDAPWWAYRHFDRVRKGGHQLPFGGELIVGHDSVLRIGFTNLQQDGLDGRRAGALRLYANQEHVRQQAVDQSAILITDVAEIVMWCLRAAGFKEWEVDYTGVNAKMPLQVDKAKSLMDIVNMVKDQVGYTFFIAEPTNNDLSIGVPIFRLNSVMRDRPDQVVREVRDSDLLTDQRLKVSNAQERTIIRTYGGMNTPDKMLPKNERANGNRVQQPSGAMTFRHQTRTLPPSAAYVPPWKSGMAGVIKHFAHYDATFVTAVDCEFAALLVALQIALSKYTTTIAMPWTPAIGLDSFVSVVDAPSGTDSRLYTTNRNQTITTGEDAKAILELGGSLVDNPDIQQLRKDWQWAVATMDRNDW